MKVTITELTRNSSGTYNQSGDMAPDLISHCLVRGEDGQLAVEIPRDDLEAWLGDEGFSRDDSFGGWLAKGQANYRVGKRNRHDPP